MNSQTCPACGELGSGGASWCEACGADFAGEHAALEGPACVDCQADHAHIADGYCGQCGRKQPGDRDHLTEQLGSISAVTDRGKRHHRNEDAFALGTVDDSLIIVVCDGVSTTDNPQDASLAAATAARDFLVAALETETTDVEAALVGATRAAQSAAAEIPTVPGGEGPSSTTFVATVVTATNGSPRTWTAWLGDSRAYWRDDEGLVQLTNDHVWEQSITRWLGADAGDTEPAIHIYDHAPGGSLLVCSDGLWKYVAAADDLMLVIDTTKSRDDVLTTHDLAEGLVKFANDSGGHDNTTVVIATMKDGKQR